jgi:ABC-type spermidine/putrescine transport system permease subunit II
MVRSGVSPKINALSALLVVASVVLVAGSALLARPPRNVPGGDRR